MFLYFQVKHFPCLWWSLYQWLKKKRNSYSIFTEQTKFPNLTITNNVNISTFRPSECKYGAINIDNYDWKRMLKSRYKVIFADINIIFGEQIKCLPTSRTFISKYYWLIIMFQHTRYALNHEITWQYGKSFIILSDIDS
jgi:hypothetical protein